MSAETSSRKRVQQSRIISSLSQILSLRCRAEGQGETNNDEWFKIAGSEEKNPKKYQINYYLHGAAVWLPVLEYFILISMNPFLNINKNFKFI